eukprot:TRINITY_DN25865_c2_g1_i2.p1 TRINITY_DN25865_c2_g1~~TRINITY_DN25865_c2_g1_i2.p1  ORF type:complete len:101 (+),score=14.72 TRINITY_DN25865_c2_g1_i2:319-621(+)
MRESPAGKLVLGTLRGWDAAAIERKCQEHDFDVLDALFYMCFHLSLNLVGPLLALPCYLVESCQGAMLTAMVLLAIHGGSGRYSKFIHLSDELRKLGVAR